MIFMTGGATTEEAMDFIEQDRARVLLKPFSPEDLRLEIASLLARHGPQGGSSRP
jgi:DNA-binding response OmpR family regulator